MRSILENIFKNHITGIGYLCLLLTVTYNAKSLAYEPLTQEQCTRIDLRSETCPDGSSRLPPLRSQGMTNYCFAYATTEILSYASCRHFSALSSGLLANLQSTAPLKDPSNPINLGGNPRNLVQLLSAPNQGPCLESDFASSPEEILGEPSSGQDFLMGFYNRRNSSNPLNCTRQTVTRITLNSPLASTPDYSDVTNTQLQQALTNALEVNRVPAIVHVDSAVVFDNKPASPTRPEVVGANHYVNVVGRQWRTDSDGAGHCYYMYRDQYSMTESPWPRVQSHDGEVADTLPEDQYFYIWVREENLLNSADDVIYAD